MPSSVAKTGRQLFWGKQSQTRSKSVTNKETYEVVKAHAAVRHAAGAQGQDRRSENIAYEDVKGGWHSEVARGGDRPETEGKL